MTSGSMHYGRALLLCISAGAATLCAASDSIEGLWQGQSGPEDNRATFALEIARSAAGELQAALSIDALGVFGQPLGAVQETSVHSYAVPAADMTLTPSGNELLATGLLLDPKAEVALLRTTQRLAPPPRVEIPVGPKPLWTTRLGGAIYAPATIAHGVAFVGNADGVFSAISVIDGRKLWAFAAGRPIFGEALAADGAVFFVCDNGYLYRLDSATGGEIWRYDLGGANARRVLPNPFIFDYDYWSPRPVLADGVLYVGSADGTVRAVRADTGKTVWHMAGAGAIRKSVVVAGSRLIFGSQAGLLRAVDRDTGKPLWHFDAKSPLTEPAVIAGKLLVGTRDSALYALDPLDGHVLWSQYWWGSWVESTVVERGGLAYVGSGDLASVSCIDPASGHNLWRTSVGGWVLQRPLVTDRLVYVGVSGARRAASFWPPQASALTVLDRSTGRVLWQWSMPEQPGAFLHGFVAAPVMAEGKVIMGGVDGSLYAFKAD